MSSLAATIAPPHAPTHASGFTFLDARYAKESLVHKVHQQELPLRGSAHNFVGADQGNVGISVFLYDGVPGSGPDPHRHPYDEVQFIRSGRARYVVDGKEFEAGAGDILVIKAGEVHSFKAIGEERLVEIDVHLSPRFIQENLPVPTPP